MSGYTDSFIAGHGVLEEGLHLLHKPFTEEALMRSVREILDEFGDLVPTVKTDMNGDTKETDKATHAETPVLTGGSVKQGR